MKGGERCLAVLHSRPSPVAVIRLLLVERSKVGLPPAWITPGIRLLQRPMGAFSISKVSGIRGDGSLTSAARSSSKREAELGAQPETDSCSGTSLMGCYGEKTRKVQQAVTGRMISASLLR